MAEQAPSSKPRTCPTDAELSDFSTGKLVAEAAESIAEHLAGCSRCLATLEALQDTPDELIEGLRHTREALPVDEDQRKRAVEIAVAVGSQSGNGGAPHPRSC